MKKYDVECYADATDFYYEMGAALGGNRVFPSVEDLLEHETCAKHCGVVKVKISLIEDVIKCNHSGDGKTIQEWKEWEKTEECLEHRKERVKAAKKVLDYYQNKVNEWYEVNKK